MNIKNRIIELVSIIIKANEDYYINDNPLISDNEYDKLFKELVALETRHPDFKSEFSPTNKVGSPLKNAAFSKVEHKTPMLSLDNALTREEFIEFFEKLNTNHETTNLEFLVEYKFDGLAVELEYRNGKFFRGSTRGDGTIGENVTHNLIKVSDILSEIESLKSEHQDNEFEVRGEIILPLAAFKALNKERMEAEEKLFANPRNAAAGSLRQLDSESGTLKKLKFFAYDIKNLKDSNFKSQEEILSKLSSLGFEVGRSQIISTVEELFKYYDELSAARAELPFEIDGLVVKVNSITVQEQLGFKSRSPRWAIALKFPPQEAVTKLLGITLQVGRTGVVTPVAELEEILVGGVSVKRATLHNEEEIKRKDLRIGDFVIVRRQGDVIPAVIKAIEERRDGSEIKFSMPQTCPECGHQLMKENPIDVHYRCSYEGCSAKLIERLKHFVSRGAFNIDKVGEKLIIKLLKDQIIKDMSDIFRLKLEDIKELERQGEKSARNTIESIENSKEVLFNKYIFSLGIKYVGEQTSKTLAKNFLNIEALESADFDDLINLPDVGEKVAKSIINYFQDENERKIRKKLVEFGVRIKYPRAIAETLNENFVGKNIAVTGSLENFKREDVKNIIEQNGGKFSTSVTKKTDFVLIGKDAGSKLAKAKELGIKIVDENEFILLTN